MEGMITDRPLQQTLPLEQEVEDEANSHTGLAKYYRVAKCENKKFLMSGLMFGATGFIYSFMRILKDTYVMSRQEPNCILYIKIFYIMPLSFLIVLLINHQLSKRTVSKLFSVFCFGFMSIFFALGGLVVFEESILIYPDLMKTNLGLKITQTKGLGFLKYLIMTLNEPLATFVYIVAELWGSLILSYLFFSFMNEICTEKQHSRFIPPLFIIANLSLLGSSNYYIL